MISFYVIFGDLSLKTRPLEAHYCVQGQLVITGYEDFLNIITEAFYIFNKTQTVTNCMWAMQLFGSKVDFAR